MPVTAPIPEISSTSNQSPVPYHWAQHVHTNADIWGSSEVPPPQRIPSLPRQPKHNHMDNRERHSPVCLACMAVYCSYPGACTSHPLAFRFLCDKGTASGGVGDLLSGVPNPSRCLPRPFRSPRSSSPPRGGRRNPPPPKSSSPPPEPPPPPPGPPPPPPPAPPPAPPPPPPRRSRLRSSSR